MTYAVQPGDTLWSIARMFGVDMNELMRRNGKTEDYLWVGEILSIPQQNNIPRWYMVQDGDTMYNIASRFGMTLPALLALNVALDNNAIIYPGQVIRLK